MVNHWEVGVVISFRDAQWLKANPSASLPPLNISLDGRAESKLGDGIHQIGERFALLEIKPDQTYFEGEWKASTGPKRAYRKLMNLAALNENNQSDKTVLTRLAQSTRGHFLAYWGDSAEPSPTHLDQLYLQPYLLTSLNALASDSPFKQAGQCYAGRPSRQHADNLLKSLIFGVANAKSILNAWPLTLNQALFRERLKAVFCLLDPKTNIVNPEQIVPVGLEVEELQSYVDFLCLESTGDGCERDIIEEDLKLILIGTSGFTRHISSTSQLREVIENYRSGTLVATQGAIPDIYRGRHISIVSPEPTAQSTYGP